MPLKNASVVAKCVDVFQMRKPFRAGRVSVSEAGVLGREESGSQPSPAWDPTATPVLPLLQWFGDAGLMALSLLRGWIVIQFCPGLGVFLFTIRGIF